MRTQDSAGAETVGAILLFGIFVGTIAFLNVTAVPQAGLTAEEDHFRDTLNGLNALQASAEASAMPGGTGTTVSEALLLGPDQGSGDGFFSFFIATPAQASGELVHNASYGNVTIYHHEDGAASRIYDVGSASGPFRMGAVVFDPNAIFRDESSITLENGALITTESDTQTLRYSPPVTLSQTGGVAQLTMKARILNGTSASIGGGGPARLSLTTEATTLSSAPAANAQNATMRIETAHGSAWGAFFNATSQSAGFTSGTQYVTTVQHGVGEYGLDLVTWRFEGSGTGNDVQLTTGLSLHRVVLG